MQPAQVPITLQTATKEQLVGRYNGLARAITSLNATVTMKLTAGSTYSGVIEQYHEINGFILAARPGNIRVIGQVPVVGKDIFDMVSDGTTFHIFIPSKNKFIEGPSNIERPAAKPIENLRPQHLTDALFWPVISSGEPVLFEEATEDTSNFYVLTIVHGRGESVESQAATTGAAEPESNWEIVRKVWFSRTDLSVARVETYDPGGEVDSDIRYNDWQPAGDSSYAREIKLSRPADDYQLQINITKLSVNEPIAADRFVLKQPPGTELVRVGQDGHAGSQP
ncbi:MAG: hypothetical protein ACRD4S_04065 [Candidatus Acidiferrales bacterium]